MNFSKPVYIECFDKYKRLMCYGCNDIIRSRDKYTHVQDCEKLRDTFLYNAINDPKIKHEDYYCIVCKESFTENTFRKHIMDKKEENDDNHKNVVKYYQCYACHDLLFNYSNFENHVCKEYLEYRYDYQSIKQNVIPLESNIKG